jgi:hypothetical protein
MIINISTSSVVVPSSEPNTLSFWHGGNLPSFPELIPQKKSRFEYGSGLYLTTHYDTARKYSKGSRKLYMVTIRKGVDARNAGLEYGAVCKFVNSIVLKNKRKDILERFDIYMTRMDTRMLNASVFSNIILNEGAITATNTVNLSKFLVSQHIDYVLVPNAFGWNEMMVVLFNMDNIVNVVQIMPKDKITVFNLPTEFN